ncbi:MAG: outer membrane beta-barrel family protein, partial [Duncaniella sp.]|nr:outer membrane beta-barrel family protein [Duncaniella sp.]
MKLYKAFCNNRFSVTIEANDIFNGSNRDMTLLNKDVTICKVNTTNNRSFFLTLQYSFNTTRDRYRGHGAGANEMNRF